MATPERSTSDERSAILAAAWDVVERSGFEGFKVQLVMRGAGVSARTFYRHFVDKDALVIALMQDETARASTRLAAAVAKVDTDDPVGQVAAWIFAVLSAAADPLRIRRTRLFTVQQSAMRHFPTEASASMDLLIEPLRRAIQRGVDGGLFPWADADRDARLISAITGAELTRAVGPADAAAVATAIEDVTGFALRALGVAPRPSSE